MTGPRIALSVVTCCWLLAAAEVDAQRGRFQVEIEQEEADWIVPHDQGEVELRGKARIVGGVPRLDLFLVMDSSKSLRLSDPEDHRKDGAIGLVKSLQWTDALIGVVDIDKKGTLRAPLSANRTSTMKAIRELDQKGKTDLAKGIRTALDGFAEKARPGSIRMLLVFTDGRVKEKSALRAMDEAREQGVSISTVLLGSSAKGTSVLQEMAEGSGGTFVAVRDPEELPDAFLSLQTGVQRVGIQVGEAEPIAARLTATGFSARVPLEPGENRISVQGASIDGREANVETTITVRPPGCAELTVEALRDGRPALSVSERGVAFVVDGSGSMWGRMGGRTKIEIAKEILDDALDWLPPDLTLSLRAYGHRVEREAQDCQDTELLVSPADDNRAAIRAAIAGLEPKGQTPLAYSLGQVGGDFGAFQGERAVVLVTDGVESCEGDAPAAARALQPESGAPGIPVHVIGFGLAGASRADLESLRAIADASGGVFVTAGSGDELRSALGTTVGTPYRVLRGDRVVARGSLGNDEPLRLPAGSYRFELDSTPRHEQPLELGIEEGLRLVLSREGRDVAAREERTPIAFGLCEDPKMAGSEATSP